MNCPLLAAALSVLVVATTHATASGRYAVIERGDTVIRVDTQTGRVSFCKDENGKPSCKIAADERNAWMAEVEQLERRISQLEGKLSGSSGALSSKDEEELDKAMDTAETMIRRFFDIMKTLRSDLQEN